MSITVQMILYVFAILILVNADRIIKITGPARKVITKWLRPVTDKIIFKISRYLLRKSFKAAMADALAIKKKKDQKVYLLLWNGDWEAMPKQNFKIMWHHRPGMKKRTIQEWERTMIEV